MLDLFAGVGSLLWGIAGVGFVWFLHRIAKPLGAALEASARRDGSKMLGEILKRLVDQG